MRTIQQISTERHYAWMHFQNVSATNIANLTPVERVDLDMAYAEAKADYLRLEDEYHTWIEKKRREDRQNEKGGKMSEYVWVLKFIDYDDCSQNVMYIHKTKNSAVVLMTILVKEYKEEQRKFNPNSKLDVRDYGDGTGVTPFGISFELGEDCKLSEMSIERFELLP